MTDETTAATSAGTASQFAQRESVVAGKPWRNWAGNIQVVPAYTVTASNEADVQEAVKFALANNLKVRVVGTGHSWTGLGETSGVLIDVRNIRHFSVKDRERKLVTLGARHFDLRRM